MALFVKQNENRSELQTKIAADLKQRLKDREQIQMDKPDPAILDNQRTTSGWGVLITLLLIIVGALTLYLLRP